MQTRIVPVHREAPNYRRVVVTGIGMVTPLGSDRESSWRRLCAGDRGARPLTAVELRLPATAGECVSAAGDLIGAPAAKSPGLGECTGEPVVDLALAAADEALGDAGLRTERLGPTTGCVIGTSKGGLRTFAALAARASLHPPSSILHPLFSSWWPNAPALSVARRFGIEGPLLCPVAACATGLVALIRGWELIRDGACDVVLAGASDASLVPAVLGSFRRLGVLARSDGDAAAACRPFDRRRSGFVVGEGAAVLVLEALDHARRRGVTPYAEWLWGATAADVAGLTTPDPQGRGMTRLISDTLRRT
ncbi:MAG: beta-ketoacyl-[acyl-carrier-protein] synthase family protein, partial [Planctomycetes bacterium]|nr:beta-ketoacyl-[acyl-carrier-protein] synthase family protein [Planctomycetota bacterium]